MIFKSRTQVRGARENVYWKEVKDDIETVTYSNQSVGMSWANKIPEEMLHQPKALVALSGLDATFNAVHKSMLDAFSNLNRSDRVPLRFKLFPGDHEYPKAKTKRTSYEWYVPKGILKSNWMRKHLEEIPAVVAIFFDLDWDEPSWRERQMECATRVEIVRKSLQGRGTKVAVVLIQKRTPLPPGEDMQATERAQAICAACELSAKNLFVLPQSDHLMGYIIRLENAFSELAYSYYQSEAKKIKGHKEFLNKTTHQLLFVRHQFKIAYFNEMKQDVVVALKHYRLAYNHILDLRMHEAHLLEIKTVAGFINYKICKLAFQQNSPLDAIPQFRKHIEHFRHRVGIQGLQFEHAAWMSKQFEIFGDLFHEAIRQGLAALQTQHPGFYYHQAGKYAISRKQLSRSLCSAPSGPDLHEEYLNALKTVEFYGQRPWRQGNQSIDPPDPNKEKEGIAALQTLEYEVQHAAIIIPLLNNAVAQFKRYRSPRMKQYLLVTMGEEHFDAGEFRQALVCLSRVLGDYRREKWWSILTGILSVALKCAYLTANAGEYASVCLELLEGNAAVSEEERRRLQANLMLLLSGRPPHPEPTCNPEAVESARTLWLESAAERESEHRPLTIEMSLLDACLDCKVAFDRGEYQADFLILLRVFLHSSCPSSISFHRLSVFFTNPGYDTAVQEEICVGPNAVHTLEISLTPHKEDVGHQIRVHAVELEFREEGRATTVLRWNFSKPESTVFSAASPSHPGSSGSNWRSFVSRTGVDVIERKSKMQVRVKEESPALVGEEYRVPIEILSEEPCLAEDVKLEVGIGEEEDGGLRLTLDGEEGARKVGSVLGNLESGSQINCLLLVKCLASGTRKLSFVLSYTVRVQPEGGESVECAVVKRIELPLMAVDPFSIEVSLRSLSFQRESHIKPGQPFIIVINIRNVSPWTLEVAGSVISPQYVRLVDPSVESQLSGIVARPLDNLTEAFALLLPDQIASVISMGTYAVQWRRKRNDDVEESLVATDIPLPGADVLPIPLLVAAQLPAFGVLRAPMPVTYLLENRSPYPKEVEAQMEPVDGFMFSGNRHAQFRVLPHTIYYLCYNLYPLDTGEVALPRLHLKLQREDNPDNTEVLTQHLPRSVFVKPCGSLTDNSAVENNEVSPVTVRAGTSS